MSNISQYTWQKFFTYHILIHNHVCTIGALWLAVPCCQRVVSTTDSGVIATAGDGVSSMWHQCNTVECSIVYLQCPDNSRCAGRHNPTDASQHRVIVVVVRTPSQVVAWLRGVWARGRCTVSSWQRHLLADACTAMRRDLADCFRHTHRYCHRWCYHNIVILIVKWLRVTTRLFPLAHPS